MGKANKDYGNLCRHKGTCKYWRSAGNMGKKSQHCCHYPIDRGELRPWPAEECPGFPQKGEGSRNE